MEAAQISRSLDSIDVGFVPGNYAYAAGMDYSKALGIEKVSEPIKNVVAVAAKNENTIGKLFKDAVESKELLMQLAMITSLTLSHVQRWLLSNIQRYIL